MMKILVCDHVDTNGLDILNPTGFRLMMRPGLQERSSSKKFQNMKL